MTSSVTSIHDLYRYIHSTLNPVFSTQMRLVPSVDQDVIATDQKYEWRCIVKIGTAGYESDWMPSKSSAEKSVAFFVYTELQNIFGKDPHPRNAGEFGNDVVESSLQNQYPSQCQS